MLPTTFYFDGMGTPNAGLTLCGELRKQKKPRIYLRKLHEYLMNWRLGLAPATPGGMAACARQPVTGLEADVKQCRQGSVNFDLK